MEIGAEHNIVPLPECNAQATQGAAVQAHLATQLLSMMRCPSLFSNAWMCTGGHSVSFWACGGTRRRHTVNDRPAGILETHMVARQ